MKKITLQNGKIYKVTREDESVYEYVDDNGKKRFTNKYAVKRVDEIEEIVHRKSVFLGMFVLLAIVIMIFESFK